MMTEPKTALVVVVPTEPPVTICPETIIYDGTSDSELMGDTALDVV